MTFGDSYPTRMNDGEVAQDIRAGPTKLFLGEQTGFAGEIG
jgi:hypothetical protein